MNRPKLRRWSDTVQLGLCAGVTALWADVGAQEFWRRLTAPLGVCQYWAAALLAPALGAGGLVLLAAWSGRKTGLRRARSRHPTFVVASVIGMALYAAFHVTWGRLGMPRLADVLGVAYLPLLLWRRPVRASDLARPPRQHRPGREAWDVGRGRRRSFSKPPLASSRL